MKKIILNMNDLIKFIETNKNIDFKSDTERKRLKNMIEKYDYSNIFSLKYFFATGRISKINNGIKEYSFRYDKKTKYKDLEKQYLKLLKLENKIREAVLIYETELKSHFKFFLEDFLKIQNIDFHFFINNLLEFDFSTKQFKKFELTEIEKEWKRQILAYSQNSYIDYCDYYHLLIKILSFGTIGKILDANYDNKKVFTLFYNYLKRDNKFSIGKIFKDLETIIILRNGLCHKESLIIFLEKGFRKNILMKGKSSRNYLLERINATSKIYEYCYNYSKKLDSSSWVKNYSKYRISNGINGNNFKKIKIDI